MSHEPVGTPTAALIVFVFKVASGPEKKGKKGKARGSACFKRTLPAPSLWPGVVQNHRTLFKGSLRLSTDTKTCQVEFWGDSEYFHLK